MMQSIDARRCWLLASGLCLAYMVGTVQAQACIKPEGGPNMVLSPEFIGMTEFEDGSSVRFKCDTGYQAAGGSSSITCTSGQWSTLTMTCKRKNCGNPGEIMNGRFDITTGTEFGDTVVATCDTGYKLIGSDRRQCMDAGWNGRVPTCEVSKCGRAPTVVNGKPSSNEESYDYGAVIRYTCNPGFTIKGNKSIVCKGDEVFVPEPPQCIKVDCPAPDVANAIVIDGNSPPYGYKSFLTYKCKTGFEINGANSITCEIESEWNPPIPECKKAPPPTTTKASPTPTTTTKTSPTTTRKVPVPDPDPKPNIGVIVGSVIGTLVQSAAVLLLIHYSFL
ncbi:complement receptor type 1-like isoform X3 [Hypomesus transpacificus]|uniref:complement receptor type 1-like isoform X3 n=1 Tax=Hypomesus transpacificus TaxID=137520 RepID=UPI001F082040|nr:complement receptor type 1-like isoform X3 [Hypomesus transpacificus]